MGEIKRVRFLDVAKGLAIICIIIGHVGMDSIDRVVYTFHVPLFFLLSGYFLSETQGMGDFAKKKARMLLVPYFVTCAVIIILGTLYGCYQGNALKAFWDFCYASLYGSGANYEKPFEIKAIGAIWFLWALFWASLFMRALLYLKAWIRMPCVILLFLFGAVSKNWFWFPLSIQSGACATGYLYVGYLFRKSEGKLKELPKETIMFGYIVAALLWFSFIKDFQHFWIVCCNFGRGFIDVVSSVCACLIVLRFAGWIDEKSEFLSKFLSFFGRFSLLVLCLHIVELDVFPWWVITEKFFGNILDPTGKAILLLICRLVFNLFGAWILSKIRIVRILFGYEKRTRKQREIGG